MKYIERDKDYRIYVPELEIELEMWPNPLFYKMRELRHKVQAFGQSLHVTGVVHTRGTWEISWDRKCRSFFIRKA